ncbi:MAG: glycosyltransferase [Pirellulaceae bacterium]|nr:glycosyltransferase [Pirellulaceae bacterium]
MPVPHRATVSLTMIARNEEHNLRDCLAPLAGLFDEVVVVDTGSHDRTREVAAELGAKVFEFPWCDDFSAARNAALDHASSDYALWLDADDRLDTENRLKLRQVLDQLRPDRRAYLMACLSPAEHVVDDAAVITHCRLFPRMPEVRWGRRVHEQILPSLERAGAAIAQTDVQITHLGYRDPAQVRRKVNRDLRLLRLEYAIDPGDAVTLFNLGLTHMRIGAFGDALTYLLSSLKNARGQADWMRRLFALASEALQRLSRREEALSVLSQGEQLFPHDAELLTRKANLLCQVGDLGGAERVLVRLLRAPREQHLLAGGQAMLDRREGRCLLGMIYRDQNRPQEAERVFQELLGEHADYVRAWVGLGYVYLGQERWGDLNHVCQQLHKCQDGQVYAMLLKAEGMIARGELADAKPLIDQAILLAPKMVWARLVLAGWLGRTASPIEECQAAFRDILRLDPGNAAAIDSLKELERRQDSKAAGPLCWTITV